MFLFKYLPIRPLTSLHIPQTSIVPLTPFTCNTIWDNEGAKSYSKRVGRGPGSGKGKTCGRGHKGRKQRRGGTVKLWYEGGQANIIKRLPKRGFSRAQFNEPLETINFDKLYYYIERGRLNPSDPITIKSMWNAGAFGQIKYGVKLLARGAEKIDRPLHFEVMDASQTAIDQVKKAGGSVTIIYKTPVQVKYMIKPETFEVPIQEDSIPPPYVAIKLEKMKQKGVNVQYNQPEWIKNVDLKTFEVQSIAKLVASDKKRVKPQVFRHYNFEV